MDFSLSGLASGFDWKTFVDQIMTVQSAPITKLNNEKTTNINKNAALVDLDSKLASLQTAVTALGSADLFHTRQVTSSTAGSSWQPLAAASTPTGSYQIAVSKLATTARREGVPDLGKSLNTVDDGVGLTLATLPTATPITAGFFTVNGHRVDVALTDTLDQVFTAIATATATDATPVSARYEHLSDAVTLDGGAGNVMLGAANDTSNFLAAMKLANNNGPTVSSFGRLGTLKTSATLATAQLSGDPTVMAALVAAGSSTFAINGVDIAYDVNTDSVNSLLARINASSAGVVASYDGASDRITLTNAITGDTGITVTDAPGGLAGVLGLTGGSQLVRGGNAEFTVNGGPTLISSSNTLDTAAHGIPGLSVTVDSETTQTVSVTGDTASMRSGIESFIAAFNDLQNYIEDNTKVTSANGKVTTAILSDNREIDSWSHSLRSIAFGAVPGLSGTISRLENLGIDFRSGTSKLEIKDSSKLDTALRDRAGDVAALFQTSGTGLTAQLGAFLDKITQSNDDLQTGFTRKNTDIDAQIANIQRRLDQQKALLTASFVAMESAQQKIQTQSNALSNAFPSTTTTTTKK